MSLACDDLHKQLWDLAPAGGCTLGEANPMIRRNNRIYADYLTKIKPTNRGRRPFIVADTEIVIVENKHIPYAIGFLVVRPGDDITSKKDHEFECYYSEDHLMIFEDFHKRSEKMLFEFVGRLTAAANKTKVRQVYFHNFSCFDGIPLLRYYANNLADEYDIKTLYRNNKLYEIVNYRKKRVILHLRDSLTLLSSTLDSLGKTFYPELGVKGSVDHECANR